MIMMLLLEKEQVLLPNMRCSYTKTPKWVQAFPLGRTTESSCLLVYLFTCFFPSFFFLLLHLAAHRGCSAFRFVSLFALASYDWVLVWNLGFWILF